MQAGAVMQQIGLRDVAAHAVAEQHDRHAGVLLADVLVEAGQVAHHFGPTVTVGEMPQCPVFGSFAMSALIRRINTIALIAEFFCQTRVAAAVFRHAVSQQDHRLEWACGQPLVDEETAAVTGGQPEGVVDHGDSFPCRGRELVALYSSLRDWHQPTPRQEDSHGQ
ncbi:hypothetical protein D3C86_1470740 [compost metagenome]